MTGHCDVGRSGWQLRGVGRIPACEGTPTHRYRPADALDAPWSQRCNEHVLLLDVRHNEVEALAVAP